MKNPFVLMAMAAAAQAQFLHPLQKMAARIARATKSASYYKPNGEAECSRRRKQIASGFLRKENGLDIRV